MRLLFFLVPGSLDTRTGGSIYDKRMVESLRARGWAVEVRELDESFPRPTSHAREHAARVLAAIPDRALVVVDGLALGAMPGEIERESPRLRVVALVHQPLADEAGIDADAAARLEASERRALAAVRAVIVTGASTARALAHYGVARERIEVVEPGTERAPLARGSKKPSALGAQPFNNAEPFRLHLICVATLNAGKGHELLFQALSKIPHRNWRLTCAGSLNREPSTAARLRDQLRADGLEEHVSLAGDVDAKALSALYDSADLFVLATLHETYGMAVAEALAHGLPVISTTTGAIPELVGSEADVLVPPGDSDALAVALSTVLADPAMRQRLAEGARRVRDRLPTWEEAGGRMAAALERIAHR